MDRRKKVSFVGAKLQKGNSGTLKINLVRFIVLLNFSHYITADAQVFLYGAYMKRTRNMAFQLYDMIQIKKTSND